MFPVCVYAVAGVGLYAIGASRHNGLAIQGLFAAYPEWLERLWPSPGQWHRWDAGAAAGDLLAASVRCSYGEPPPPPSPEIVRLRPLPPPPFGRL